ncbi:MAG TPA: Os1348 family NHLP clan protein [Candidatus Limnocylindrales bacterium]|nr:Os1348 family NHLP clan protein [Candidatus Limnocylindrales bacterium]
MSKTALADVVKRAIGDAAFRRQLQKDPDGALKGFNLSADETAAVRSGDPAKLMSLGIDQRMSKAFALDVTAGAASTPSRWGGVDVSSGTVDEPTVDGGSRGSTDALATGAAASDKIIGDLASARAAGVDFTQDDFGRTMGDASASTASADLDAGAAAGAGRAVADSAGTGGGGDAYITADEAGTYGVKNADSFNATETEPALPDGGLTPPETNTPTEGPH